MKAFEYQELLDKFLANPMEWLGYDDETRGWIRFAAAERADEVRSRGPVKLWDEE